MMFSEGVEAEAKNELEVQCRKEPVNPIPSFRDSPTVSPTPVHHPVRHTASPASPIHISGWRPHYNSPQCSLREYLLCQPPHLPDVREGEHELGF